MWKRRLSAVGSADTMPAGAALLSKAPQPLPLVAWMQCSRHRVHLHDRSIDADDSSLVTIHILNNNTSTTCCFKEGLSSQRCPRVTWTLDPNMPHCQQLRLSHVGDCMRLQFAAQRCVSSCHLGSLQAGMLGQAMR